MSEETKKSPEPKLRGTLLKGVAKPAGSMAVSSLKGTLAVSNRSEEEAAESRLAPEDYDLPESVAETIARRASSERLTPFEDPDGVIIPGRVFLSKTDPARRRLVTNVYTTSKGDTIAAVHIEGESGLRNLSLPDLQQRIGEGSLIPPEPAK